ncbi:MAG: hypothetical protein J6W76_00805, partial [Spirochaetales bacterium]|nr:hypothetical protein [Spirochaetales bacterium]
MSESICTQKDPLQPDRFISNANKINEIIRTEKSFIFYFSPDPDAVGASVALALYIRRHSKECTIYLPDGFDKNLDFLFDIAIYNNINVVQDMDILKNIIETADTITQTQATLRFGHEVCVMPLACLLELDNCGMAVENLDELDK